MFQWLFQLISDSPAIALVVVAVVNDGRSWNSSSGAFGVYADLGGNRTVIASPLCKQAVDDSSGSRD